MLASSVLALSISQALAAGVKFAGVNIAGFDFGCSTDGNCNIGNVYGPIKSSDLSSTASADGPGQMNHFATKDKLNIFRLPVGWQFLVNLELGGTLDSAAFGQYDRLMQACLKTGAYCIIDIHNYARWNGKTIGSSGGPSNEDFASLWKQLATKYAAEEKVVMGLMNEPHNMPDLASWAGSVQAAVTAIRGAGATSQMILLPGDGYTGASTFVSGGSAAALAGVTNPDKSTTNLIFDVHQYLDGDGSGTSATCTKTSDVFAPLLKWLKSSNRQAMLTEIGGGSSDASCITNVCEVLDFLNTNSDQFLGYVGWAAGSFDSSYVLSLVPDGGNDVPLMEKCFAAKFGGGSGTSPAAPVSSSGSGSESDQGSGEGSGEGSGQGSGSGSGTTSPISSSAASPPIATTSGPALQLPSHVSQLPPSPTSSTPAIYGLGQGPNQQKQQPAQIGGNILDNDLQDDCDAEWEDVPTAPEPSTVTKRNGMRRLAYAEEI
ncbi:hypothetical protein ACLMJK_008792 [Lecanora helva]